MERIVQRTSHDAEMLRRIDNLELALESLSKDLRADIQQLARETRNHVRVASCFKIGSQSILYGGGGGGIVAVVVMMGKLLGWW